MSLSRRDFLSLLPLAVAPAVLRGGTARPRAASSDTPNVLVVVFDTLSTANMSLYGYPRTTTPVLSRLAQEATVYHTHYAAGNYTVPGTASLLTGLYPHTHRALHQRGTLLPAHAAHNLFSLFDNGSYARLTFSQNLWVDYLLTQFDATYTTRLDPAAFSLIDLMAADRVLPRDAYMASTSEYYAFNNPRESTSLLGAPLLQGWHLARRRRARRRLRERYPRGLPQAGEKSLFLLEDAIDGLQAWLTAAPQPFLAYIHLWPPHSPYNPSADFIDIFDPDLSLPQKPRSFAAKWGAAETRRSRRHYDENVAYADAAFGRLFAALQRNGLRDNTLIIFTSDHGELFERGVVGHNNPLLYEPLIHIPLVVWLPGERARRDIYQPTSSVDLLPTLQQWRGAPIPPWAQGRPLPGFGATNAESERPIFAIEAKSSPQRDTLQPATIAVRVGALKLIQYRGYPAQPAAYELFDLAADPEELDNLFATHPDAADLVALLEQEMAAHHEAE